MPRARKKHADSSAHPGSAVIPRLGMTGTREFRQQMLGWFRHARRAMPWRGIRDPYRIWLSEVMLQQTRVAAVVPYYERFVRRYPTVQKLARARSEEALRLWAGLGYYSRARNLHRAAKEIVARHHGRFPRDLDAALALPGVGRYTAAAVLSIAYGQPLAVLDGNAARVLARLGAIRGDLRAPKQWKHLEAEAQRLLDPRQPADWNQAMMELGATICTPRSPRCGECPVAKWCRAYRLGIAEELPAKRRKRAPEQVEIAAAVLVDPRGRTLLVREDGGLFSKMWQFPSGEVRRNGAAEVDRSLRKMAGLSPPRTNEQKFKELASVKHAVTFREVTIRPFLTRVSELIAQNGARVVPLKSLGQLPVSSATRKVARVAVASCD